MWDISIRGLTNYQKDIVKAYFIVNKMEYAEQNEDLVFYVDTVDKFFSIITSIVQFYAERRQSGWSQLVFSCYIDENGNYYIEPVDFYDY